MKCLLLAVTACLAVASFARDVSKATSPRSRERENKWWGPRHEQKLDEIKTNGNVDVVFIGDSITHYWERERHIANWRKWTVDSGFTARNLGFSGDQTENVIWRLVHGELDGYKTSVVVLMIGTNNAGHLKESEEPATNVAAGVRTILDLIREKQPQAKVVLCAILPRGRKEDFANNVPWRNLEANVLLRRLCDGENVVWCDFANEFLAKRGKPDRQLFEDQLHPTDAGYDVFGAAVLPVIRCLLAGEKN